MLTETSRSALSSSWKQDTISENNLQDFYPQESVWGGREDALSKGLWSGQSRSLFFIFYFFESADNVESILKNVNQAWKTLEKWLLQAERTRSFSLKPHLHLASVSWAVICVCEPPGPLSVYVVRVREPGHGLCMSLSRKKSLCLSLWVRPKCLWARPQCVSVSCPGRCLYPYLWLWAGSQSVSSVANEPGQRFVAWSLHGQRSQAEVTSHPTWNRAATQRAAHWPRSAPHYSRSSALASK